MEERIGKFIAALRGAGVRISLAESQDAWQALTYTGVGDRDTFRLSLRATLIKDVTSYDTFEELFPLYFGLDTPPLQDPASDLSPEQQRMLGEAMQQALQRALQELARDLRKLLEWLMNGQGPSQEELADMAQQAGLNDLPDSAAPYQARRYARRMQQLLGWEKLQELLEMLWEALAQQGMNPETIEQIKAQVMENQQALQDQLGDYAGMKLNDHLAEQAQRRPPINELMDRPFGSLNSAEMDSLREQIRRLAARLRSRAALRQQRGKKGKLDAKATLRHNLRYGSVPFEIRLKQRRRKPKLVVLLDISTSMRPVAEFFLRLLYELQDQVQKTRSFAFIDHLEDVTTDLHAQQIDQAVRTILSKMPPGYYSTDLGGSLRQFEAGYLDTVDGRTTLIVLGDARNNYNDPALDVFRTLARRSRKLIWLNPEYPTQWGTGDSDMLLYQPHCDEVFQVRNLAQLTDAIDHMLA